MCMSYPTRMARAIDVPMIVSVAIHVAILIHPKVNTNKNPLANMHARKIRRFSSSQSIGICEEEFLLSFSSHAQKIIFMQKRYTRNFFI